MFDKSAALYDLIYSFKDYKKESDQIQSIINARSTSTRTILDIGCGTGEHHRYLMRNYNIDGIDINPDFIEIARTKNPDGFYLQADMADFSIKRKYDVILCLFSSIGYVKTIDRLEATLQCFSRHLKNFGTIIVEPWLTSENWFENRLHLLTHETEAVKVCRMNRSKTEGNISIIHFHYLVGTKDAGVRYFEERHELALFSEQEMITAFEKANLHVTYDDEGITGRGLYFGTRVPDA
jgi:SAM-dependent methyltransferase